MTHFIYEVSNVFTVEQMTIVYGSQYIKNYILVVKL